MLGRMKNRNKPLRKWLYKIYIWLTELLYHQLAWAYDAVAWMVSFGQWHKWRLRALDFIKPGLCLEVGFGTGELLRAIAERGINVIGLEKSTQMQRVVNRKIRRKALKIKRVQSRVETMPFSAQVFDNVISTFPSGYILKEETLREVFRVLKKSGRMVVVGLYVVLKPPLLKRLTHWYLDAGGESFVKDFLVNAEKSGLHGSIIFHETKRYLLPVMILERNDDQ